MLLFKTEPRSYIDTVRHIYLLSAVSHQPLYKPQTLKRISLKRSHRCGRTSGLAMLLSRDEIIKFYALYGA